MFETFLHTRKKSSSQLLQNKPEPNLTLNMETANSPRNVSTNPLYERVKNPGEYHLSNIRHGNLQISISDNQLFNKDPIPQTSSVSIDPNNYKSKKEASSSVKDEIFLSFERRLLKKDCALWSSLAKVQEQRKLLFIIQKTKHSPHCR